MRTKTLITTAVMALTSTYALAQANPQPTTSTATISMVEAIQSLEKKGYTAFDEVEREGGIMYEVKATDPNGARVEVTIDGRSGEILRTKRKN